VGGAVKGNGLVTRFRWRDPHRQTLLFPKFTAEQLKNLDQNAFDDAARIVCERIISDLQKFSLEPARQDKARAVAEKLGICLGSIAGF
jgi:hypothetical protein